LAPFIKSDYLVVRTKEVYYATTPHTPMETSRERPDKNQYARELHISQINNCVVQIPRKDEASSGR
jgi:hypothetical protein